jgi:hypothetical protein
MADALAETDLGAFILRHAGVMADLVASVVVRYYFGVRNSEFGSLSNR